MRNISVKLKLINLFIFVLIIVPSFFMFSLDIADYPDYTEEMLNGSFVETGVIKDQSGNSFYYPRFRISEFLHLIPYSYPIYRRNKGLDCKFKNSGSRRIGRI